MFVTMQCFNNLKEDEEEEDNAKRLLLKILELISMDPSQHINIGSSEKNRNSIGKSARIDPCLLYRLCEVPTKLWRDRDELQILNLVHEYRYSYLMTYL